MFEAIEACQQCEPIGLPEGSYCRDCGLQLAAPDQPALLATGLGDLAQAVRLRVQRLTARAVTAHLSHPHAGATHARSGQLRQAVARVSRTATTSTAAPHQPD